MVIRAELVKFASQKQSVSPTYMNPDPPVCRPAPSKSSSFLRYTATSLLMLGIGYYLGLSYSEKISNSEELPDQSSKGELTLPFLVPENVPEDRILYSRTVEVEGVHDQARIEFQDGANLFFSEHDYDIAMAFNRGGPARIVYHLDHGPCLANPEGDVFLTCEFYKDHPLSLYEDEVIHSDFGNGSTAEMVMMLGNSADLWKYEMRRAFRALLNRVEGNQKEHLRESQLHWLKFKNTQIQFYNSLNDGTRGTMGSMNFVGQVTRIYRQRAMELLSFYVYN